MIGKNVGFHDFIVTGSFHDSVSHGEKIGWLSCPYELAKNISEVDGSEEEAYCTSWTGPTYSRYEYRYFSHMLKFTGFIDIFANLLSFLGSLLLRLSQCVV